MAGAWPCALTTYSLFISYLLPIKVEYILECILKLKWCGQWRLLVWFWFAAGFSSNVGHRGNKHVTGHLQRRE